MSKRNFILTCLLFLFIIIFGGLTLVSLSHKENDSKKNNIEKGITLDVARRFYKESEIKSIIDILSEYPNTFLQLHLSDDQNFSVENDFIHQNTDNATFENGEWKSNSSGRPFLSKEQLSELVKYARDNGVSLYPEIDFPSHNKILLEYLKIYDTQVYNSIYLGDSISNSWNTIDYSKEATIRLVETILSEYTEIFSHQKEKIFHIGGDEFFDIAPANDNDYVRYINAITAFLKEKGYKTRIWNDGVLKNNIKDFSKSIEIAFWSPTGELDDSSKSNKAIEGKRNIASAQELLNSGFKLLNYNGYYGYFMAGDRTFIPQAYKYTINDLKFRWNIGNFDLDSPDKVSSTRNVKGISMTIWGEESEGYTSQEIIRRTKPLLEEYLRAVTYRKNYEKY